MRAIRSFWFIVPVLTGVALGLFLTDAAWWHKDNGVWAWIESVSGLEAFFYLPAVPLFYALVFLHIGPSGDAGWEMYPWCILASWVFIGAILGLFLFWRYGRSKHIV